jgi:16S rRNA (cytidine1402-2'-O)-methyltransferase
MLGTLYLVATPIGNLGDITFRAVEILKSVDLIACEDTRHSRKLLNHLNIKQKLISYHEHNEIERADELTKMLLEGKNIAVISDAGTPAICDPSFRITNKAIEIGAKVVPIPGAVAYVNAAIVSGLPCDSLYFGGFLPSKKSERIKRLQEISELQATICFYESPHRIAKSILDCFEVLGSRNACVVREITKIHEEVISGTLFEIAEKLKTQTVKGEIVLIIDRFKQSSSQFHTENFGSVTSRFEELKKEGLDRKLSLKKIAKEFGLTRSETYRLLISSNT